jgi:carbon storage regulator
MLILTRRENESIVIQLGQTVVYVTVLEIKANQSRVGVSAPRDVSVDREEVYQRKVREAKVGAEGTSLSAPSRAANTAIQNR